MKYKFEYGDFSTWTLVGDRTSVTLKKHGGLPIVLFGSFEYKFRTPQRRVSEDLTAVLGSIGFIDIVNQFNDCILIGNDSEQLYPVYSSLENEFNIIMCNQVSIEYLTGLLFNTIYNSLTNIETDFEIVSINFNGVE
jgi:hypothetical protein